MKAQTNERFPLRPEDRILPVPSGRHGPEVCKVIALRESDHVHTIDVGEAPSVEEWLRWLEEDL